jgi:tRNA A37 methylthiotransferase MiaB
MLLNTDEQQKVKEFVKNNSYIEALEKLNKVNELDKQNFKIIILGCCQKTMQEDVIKKLRSNQLKIDFDLCEYLCQEYPEYSHSFKKTQTDIKYTSTEHQKTPIVFPVLF